MKTKGTVIKMVYLHIPRPSALNPHTEMLKSSIFQILKQIFSWDSLYSTLYSTTQEMVHLLRFVQIVHFVYFPPKVYNKFSFNFLSLRL